MELIRGIHNLKPRHRGCVATIGNFDGVHRGHARLLERARERAADLGLPSCVVTFEPHSKEFFAPERAPARLTDLRGKVKVLRRHGVDRVLVLPFNRSLASLEPEAFVQRVLVEGLGVGHVVVGHDFVFGQGARGSVEDLRRIGEQRGFAAEEIAEYREDGLVVGSTAIREALAEGDLDRAERLLGRPYSLCGRVVPGDRIGRELGFPTLNLHLHHLRLPVAGVFAGRVHGAGLDGHPAAVNVGTRPAVKGVDVRVEAHLLDFHGDLYGARVELVFERRLRAERDFPGLDALREQIAADVRQAREHFGRSAE
ncbi:FMN adenylyltransferase [Thiohalorhabdus denitrificans]|uniref:Riboflavin biosynthesis protein n=1 Tax=Thiohalorhabdus denitrificans TaxID=381306 RepID=A0A0P9CNF8_9GAMM|nr:bifunctional riboflavin kinase/FAD synthetase [Thiohalorhabdus denitrificans]KPV40636.1 FMN adenylyltransferase [Thiohalorhabdus denitrificans]SCY48779.1 riboflavin kinase / FMN adenylyltransferase [Thiohalorhabdus denitrificans]